MKKIFTLLPVNILFIAGSLTLAASATAAVPMLPGDNCDEAVVATEGTYTAPNPDYWYSFTVPTSGSWSISTCDLGNTCNTKIYVYDHCVGLVPTELAEGTIAYNDDYCGEQSHINATFTAGDMVYIRIGDYNTDCAGSPINWSLTYEGAPAGCMDAFACNYSPLAITDDGSCIYPGNPLCPTGPDLVLDETYLDGDISAGFGTDYQLTTINADDWTNACYIDEGSLTGTGIRTIIKFGIRIWNLGDEDYHIGTAAENPYLVYDPCHGHYHYIDYGEYILYDSLGNETPVGHKNGFSVMDLCGMGGYTGADMGISSGCYDTYGLGTGGQWMDITDVPDGTYTFVARVNWLNHPDLEGDVEINLANNWRSRCIHIWRVAGVINAEMVDDCPAYLDCLGEIFGTAKMDCEGNCNGWHQLGDINMDTTRTYDDVTQYVTETLDNTIIADLCNDANNDSNIDVVDAALVMGCANQSIGYTHDEDLCSLPQALINTSDTVTYSIGAVNPAFNYLDIYSLNPSARIIAAQFQMQGLTIDSVVNLCPETFGENFSITHTDDEVIVLGYNEVPYQIHFEPIPTFRIFYTATLPAEFCIKHFTAAVNEHFEEVVPELNNSCVTVDATGVDYVDQNDLNVKVMPNPFSNTAVLSFTNFTGKAFEIEISDMNGNQLRNYTTHSNTITINRNDLPSGIYMYRIIGDAKSQTGKFIIQ